MLFGRYYDCVVNTSSAHIVSHFILFAKEEQILFFLFEFHEFFMNTLNELELTV